MGGGARRRRRPAARRRRRRGAARGRAADRLRPGRRAGRGRERPAADGRSPRVAQLYAGLAASALAALDDYLTAAITYIVASVAGPRVHPRRASTRTGSTPSRSGWRSTASSPSPCRRSRSSSARAARRCRAAPSARPGQPVGHRLLEAGRSAALPLALQAVYLVCLPFAAREGVGAVTSFGYAYLAAAALVAVTSSSLGLVTSVPLDADRARPRPGRTPRRVVLVARARRGRSGGRRVRRGRDVPRRRGARRRATSRTSGRSSAT